MNWKNQDQSECRSVNPGPQAPTARPGRCALGFLALLTLLALLGLLALAPSTGRAAEAASKGRPPSHRFFVSTTYLTATNPFPDSVSMYELHFGYRLTPKDTIAIKACSWKLFEPMGIPLWDSHLMKESEFYPGKIHEYGVGLSYQRFLWKGLFASIQVVPLVKRYLDQNGKKVDSGFKLYSSYHLGYHWAFLRNRFFLEPQVHINYWPIDTKGPAGFEKKEARWTNNYVLFEPNLFLGVNF